MYPKKIEIIKMLQGGFNAYIPDGPWATDTTPVAALKRLLKFLAKTDKNAKPKKKSR